MPESSSDNTLNTILNDFVKEPPVQVDVDKKYARILKGQNNYSGSSGSKSIDEIIQSLKQEIKQRHEKLAKIRTQQLKLYTHFQVSPEDSLLLEQIDAVLTKFSNVDL